MSYCHPDFGCDCEGKIAHLESALRRLASGEGMVGAGVIDQTFSGRELVARIRYAEAALQGAECVVDAGAARREPQGFSEPSVAAERLAAGVPPSSRHEGGDDG